MYKHSVPTLQQTQNLSFTKTCCLILHREKISVYYDNLVKFKRKNKEVVTINQVVTKVSTGLNNI
jgi:hypothetical protein